MKATRVHLLRHGQVVGHQEKRYNGQGDVHLTEQGRQQSAAFADRFEQLRLRAIFSSDLLRCRVAAEQIAQRHQLRPRYCNELRELHVGDWEGQPWQQLQQEAPQLWQARLEDIVHVAPPGGETVLAMAARVRPLIRRIVAAQGPGDIVVVAHGGVNRVVLLDAIGAPLERLFNIDQDYGCHNIIDYFSDGRAVVRKLNG